MLRIETKEELNILDGLVSVIVLAINRDGQLPRERMFRNRTYRQGKSPGIRLDTIQRGPNATTID